MDEVDLSGYPDHYLRCRARGHVFGVDEPRDVITAHSSSASHGIAEFRRTEQCGGRPQEGQEPVYCGMIRYQIIRTSDFEVFHQWYDRPDGYAITGAGFIHRSTFRHELWAREQVAAKKKSSKRRRRTPDNEGGQE
jgi:hypothetical protein